MNNMPMMLDVAKAQKHRSTFPLDFQHITTQDFGKTTILHTMEVMPGDELDINISAKAQLAPMVVPTFGNVNLYVRAFFVPFRFVWTDWEDFFSQKLVNKHGETLANSVPSISAYVLWTAACRVKYMVEVASDTASSGFDYYVVSTSSGTTTTKKYRLTYHGRLIRQILEGLGYVLNPAPDSAQFEAFSALPLLALTKIFRDYYVNPNYDYTTIDKILSRTFTSNTDTDSNWKYLKEAELIAILDFVSFGWYESDILTSAWSNPEGPQYSNIYSQNSKNVDSFYSGGSNRLDVVSENSGSLGNTSLYSTQSGTAAPMGGISQYGLNVLKAVRNFVLRRNVSGARYIDQLLSRFGIRLDENEARRAKFLGSFESSAVIGRVDATGSGSVTFDDNTIKTALGDYVGRGLIDNNGHFHFVNDKNDFGMVIFVSHLMPRTAYYQGIKPHINHMMFNDFFNPDLEDVGTAPIPNNVVFNRYRSNIVRDYELSQGFTNGVYGYAPNYFEYKTQFDYLTGDFSCPSLNSQLKSYELMRKFVPLATSAGQYYEDVEGLKPQLGEDVQKADKDNVEPYTRMFLTQTQDADHFIVSYGFNVRATRNCNSLGNSLLAELNEHGNDVGSLVKVRPNGQYF